MAARKLSKGRLIEEGLEWMSGHGINRQGAPYFLCRTVLPRTSRSLPEPSGTAGGWFFKAWKFKYLSTGCLRKKTPIPLTAKEFDVLAYLASYPGWVFSKAQIYERIWGEKAVEFDNAVTCLIYGVRRKLRARSEHQYIHTLHGVGYKFEEIPE